MTIPVDTLRRLHAEVGTVLELEVVEGALIARPSHSEPRPRYTLAELLQGVTPDTMQALTEETQWFRDGESVGRALF